MKSSMLKRQFHTIWEIKMNYIVEISKNWRMGLSQSRLWHLKNLANSASGNEKLSIFIFFSKNSLRKWRPNVHVDVNVHVHVQTYLQHVGLVCFFVIYMLYIDVLSSSFMFSPLKGQCWLRNKIVSQFIKLMNLQIVLYRSFSQVFLGGWR